MLAQATGKQQSPSAAEASLGAEFAGSCRDPQLSASECLTQTHGWPEIFILVKDVLQGFSDLYERTFQSSNPLSLDPDKKQRDRGRRSYCKRAPDHPSEATTLTGPKIWWLMEATGPWARQSSFSDSEEWKFFHFPGTIVLLQNQVNFSLAHSPNLSFLVSPPCWNR